MTQNDPFADINERSYGPEDEDMSNVNEAPPLPAVGWSRATLMTVGTRPSKAGKKMRTVRFEIAGGEFDEVIEYFSLGQNQTKGEMIANRNYKTLARCVGVEENDEGNFSFSTADLEGEELYVNIQHEQQDGYPMQARARGFRPLTDPPAEVVDHDINDDDPFE